MADMVNSGASAVENEIKLGDDCMSHAVQSLDTRN